MVSYEKETSGMRWFCGIGLAFMAAVPCATAQTGPSRREPDSFVNQQRAIEERLRREFETEVGHSQRALFDWGGWYSRYFFTFDDGVESSRTMRRHDLRLWGRLVFDGGAHEVYARTRVSLLDFNSGDSFDGNDDDIDGPNLERGFYRFDLAKAVRAREGRSLDYNLQVTVGRDLVLFGSGLALATPLDHLLLQGTYRGFEITGLVGVSVGSSLDFDLSRAAKRTRRTFLGGQLRYRGFERHEPFVYALWQRDRMRDPLLPLVQDFDYDSAYFGVGSSGELYKGLRYNTEWVYQIGESFGGLPLREASEIRAWAFLAELEYLFRGEHKARASIEYLMGSGDADRTLSPTNTLAGRGMDSKDTGFVGFGYHDTGLSFAPRYSNLHMWRVGASCYPWPGGRWSRRLEVGTDWYFFQKHHRAAAVSDPTANRGAGYLGWEMDYFVNWQMAADVAWTARCGIFFPGSAFGDRTTRTFVLLGITWSF